MTVKVQRIIGYSDLFGKADVFYRRVLARRIGRKRILQFTALMLTYCRRSTERPLVELVHMFFTYKDSFHTLGYAEVVAGIHRLAQREPNFDFGILSEESLLNLYMATLRIEDLTEEGNELEDRNSGDMLKLLLIYNDDLLKRFDNAKTSAYRYSDRPLLRTIFAQQFPHYDISEIEYGKLIFVQCYKLMKLLDFLEGNVRYAGLYAHLLQDFNVQSKEEFFKAIGGAALSPLNLSKPGINEMIIHNNAQSKANALFLDKLAHSAVDADAGPTDYRALRDKPLQKLPGEYRVIFDFFLIKKLYNGMVFKLSAYVRENPRLFKGQLFGAIRDEFTEAVLLYDTLNAVVSHTKTITITGNEFKAAKVEREPDYYCRFKNRIILTESKDFFIPAEEKLSYDFDIIMAGLSKDGRLKKATLQCATNVGRLLLKSLPIDQDYDSSMAILPIVVLHDSLYDTPSLNYWVNEWFQEELSKMKADAKFKGYDFSVVRSLTLVDIDTLILYRTNFEKGEMNLFDLVEEYQNYVDFKSASDKNYDHAITSFATFVYNYAANKGINIDFKLLKDTYAFSGFKD